MLSNGWVLITFINHVYIAYYGACLPIVSISLTSDLLRKLDGLMVEKGYSSRSEAVRDAIRDLLSDVLTLLFVILIFMVLPP